MPDAPHTLLLVDDHAIVRQGLAALLANDPDWRVAAEAGTYEDALAAALADPPPDGVLLDLSLRDRSGLDWIREDTLLTALHTVFSGHNHLSPAAAALLATGEGTDAPAEKPATGIASLTAREREILYAIGGRLTTREIAEKFGLSGRTVDVHRVNIRRKLECTSFAELLAKAMQFRQSEDGLPPAP